MPMKALPFLTLCAFLTVPTASAHAQTRSEIGQLFGTPVALGEAAEFAIPISHALFADGSLAILDYGRFDLTRLSPAGKVMWKSGRKGSGPGEFRLPTRVTVLADQSLIVYDPGKVGFSHLDSSGKYLGEIVSDIKIQVDQMHTLPNGDVVVSGRTTDERARHAAIHILTPQLKYVRSFGRLPEVRDPRVLPSLGMGGVRLSPDGRVVHTRYYPYEISTYTVDGTEQSRVKVPVTLTPPEEYVRVSSFEGRVSSTINRVALRAIPAWDLGNGQYIGGQTQGDRRTFDLMSSAGKILLTESKPNGWQYIVAIDFARQTFWLQGEVDDVPMVWKISFGPALQRRE